jgi:hypothetical protein
MIQQQQQQTPTPFFLFWQQPTPTNTSNSHARVSGWSENLMTHLDHHQQQQTNKQQVSETQQQDQLQLDTHTTNFLSNPIWPHKHKQHPRLY